MRSIRTVVVIAVIAFMTAALATTVVPAPAQAATVEGKACKKAGATQGDGPNRTVICAKVAKGKNKGKLFWQLINGSRTKPEYSLFFDAGCGFTLQLYHVKGVVGAVAGVVPKNPVPSSAGQPVTATRIKAGEQIGWFQGEAGKSVAFDLRMEDSSRTNSFINQARFASSPGASGELHAVCPYDFYSGTQRQRWLAKLGAPSSDPVAGTACGTISQGETGSAQGMWFFKDAQVNQLTYRGETWNEGMPVGQYQSQIAFSVDPIGPSASVGSTPAPR